MAKITLQGSTINTNGEIPKIGSLAPNFKLVDKDLSEKQLSDFKGKNILLNVFPSVDTSICANSARNFNKEASSLDNTIVLCISKDLPFALSRFCAAEGLNDVLTLSAFRCDCFEKNYGVLIIDGPLKGLLARSVFVINKEGNIVYSELVPEIKQEPNYEEAIKFLKK